MKPPQFSLSYLFVEVLCVAASLGCLVNFINADSGDLVRLPLAIGGVIFAFTALGGLFGTKGMLVGFGVPSVAIVVHIFLRLILD